MDTEIGKIENCFFMFFKLYKRRFLLTLIFNVCVYICMLSHVFCKLFFRKFDVHFFYK